MKNFDILATSNDKAFYFKNVSMNHGAYVFEKDFDDCGAYEEANNKMNVLVNKIVERSILNTAPYCMESIFLDKKSYEEFCDNLHDLWVTREEIDYREIYLDKVGGTPDYMPPMSSLDLNSKDYIEKRDAYLSEIVGSKKFDSVVFVIDGHTPKFIFEKK